MCSSCLFRFTALKTHRVEKRKLVAAKAGSTRIWPLGLVLVGIVLAGFALL